MADIRYTDPAQLNELLRLTNIQVEIFKELRQSDTLTGRFNTIMVEMSYSEETLVSYLSELIHEGKSATLDDALSEVEHWGRLQA